MVALFGLLIAPHFIDWSSYKKEFEDQATKILGQPVTVTGDAQLRILPLPSLSFSGLAVGKNSDGKPIMTVDKFSLNAELMPFLQGQLRITQMRLVRPELNLEMAEDGTIQWGEHGDITENSIAVDPAKVKLDKLIIENGFVSVKGLLAERTLLAEQVFADLSAQSLFGPWHVSAKGFFEGKAGTLKVTTGAFNSGEQVRIRVDGVRQDTPYRMVVDGPLGRDDEGALRWHGRFSVDPLDEAKADEANSASSSNTENLPVQLKGQFIATPKLVLVPEYRLEVGHGGNPYSMSGHGTFNIGHDVIFNVEVDGRQFDLNDWENNNVGEANNPADAKAKKGAGLSSRLSTIRSIVDQIPIPDAKGEIDIILPAITSGDTYIREVSAKVSPGENHWNIRSLKATLPGSTVLEADGVLGVGEDFGFSGSLTTASRQVSGLAAWLGSGDDASIRLLKSAGISANATINTRQASLEEMELILDDAVLSGSLRWLAGDDDAGAIIADLKGEAINLDQLRATYNIMFGGSNANLSDQDVELRLKAAKVDGLGLAARDVDAQLRVENGEVSVRKLGLGDFYGLKVQSDGVLNNLLSKPAGNLRLLVNSENPSQFLKMLKDRMSENWEVGSAINIDHLLQQPQLTANTSLQIEINGNNSESGASGQVLINGEIGGTKIKSTTSFEGSLDQLKLAQLEASITLKNKEPLVLAKQFAIPVQPAELKGELDVSIEMDGKLAKGLNSKLLAITPQHNLSAEGVVHYGKNNDWLADYAVSLSSSDIRPVFAASGYGAVDQGEKGAGAQTDNDLPSSFKFNLHHEGSKSRFENISGQINGNTITGKLEFEVSDTAKAENKTRKVGGELQFDKLSAEQLVYLVSGGQESDIAGLIGQDIIDQFDASGNGFGLSRLQGLEGDIKLSAKKLHLFGNSYADDFSTIFVTSGGELSLQNSNAKWLGGDVAGDVRITNKNGTVSLDTNYTASNLEADKVVSVFSLETASPPPLQGKLGISGAARSVGKTSDELMQQLSGEGVFSVGEGRIEGINLSGLDGVLEISNQEGFKLDDVSAAQLTQSAFFAGVLPFNLENQSFSVARGEVKVSNVQMVTDKGRLEIDAKLNLVSNQLNGRASVDLNVDRHATFGANISATPGFAIDFSSPEGGGEISREINSQGMHSFLSMVAIEREQRRVDIIREETLERQRLSQELKYVQLRRQRREEALEAARLKAEAEEAARIAAEEAARLAAEAASQDAVDQQTQQN